MRNALTTNEKITLLAQFRKGLAQGGIRDPYAFMDGLRIKQGDVTRHLYNEDREELLKFAMLIRSSYFPDSDKLHVVMIDTLRGWLENEVHNQADSINEKTF